jgi:hypothetical protein
MKKLCLFLFLIFNVSSLFAQPVLTPTTFLNCGSLKRMNRNYVRQTMGQDHTGFVEPSGGAMLKIDKDSFDLCIYIFCDAPAHRLLLFSLSDSDGIRQAIGVKEYGLTPPPLELIFNDTTAHSLLLPANSWDSTGFLDRPVDVATSAKGRHFKPEQDFIYVLDQGKHRVAKFRYDSGLDSLIWASNFGENNLKFPTSLDYAAYGESSYQLHDIFVADGGLSKIFRFSSDGQLEESFGYWGDGLTGLGFPTGIAVSSNPARANHFYVTDSKFRRVMGYYSETSGPIYVESEHVFPLTLPVPLLNAVDTDTNGYVYVVNAFAHNIAILTPGLDTLISVYGNKGHSPGLFDSPSDIYIDRGEVQVCELWGDSSGIQSFHINSGYPKKEAEVVPKSFSLHQNYPNPFNSQTKIQFDLPSTGIVELAIYNILGQKITTLINQPLPAGSHSIIWDGHNGNGQTVSSGIYFVRLRASDQTEVKKLLLLK